VECEMLMRWQSESDSAQLARSQCAEDHWRGYEFCWEDTQGYVRGDYQSRKMSL
jgi:hypothetical protein